MVIAVGLLFAFGAMLCWGVGDFLIQKSTKRLGDVESLLFIGLLGAVGLFPFMLNDLPAILSPSNLLLLLLLGIITFVASIFDFEALKRGKISVVDVVIELELPVTIILGFMFFQESLSLFQLLAVSFIFLGIVLIATKSFSHLKRGFERGVVLAFFAAAGMGVINFLTAASAKQISPLMAVWFPWFVIAVLCLVVTFKRDGLPKLVENGRRFKWLILVTAVFDTAAWLFYANAVYLHEIAIITAITESYPAVAMGLGVLVNKESIRVHQYFGAAMALVCSLALSLTL